MIATTDAEYHPTSREDVGSCVVFGHPQGMPHGGDVKPATELDVVGQMSHVNAQLHDVGNALVPFVLEMVLSHPECVIPNAIHERGDRDRLVEHGRQMIVGVTSIIGRSPLPAKVIQVNVACEQAPELRNHV